MMSGLPCTISEILTEKDCYKILEKHNKNDARLLKYKIYKANNKVLGYLGDHFRLKITYEDDEENKLKELTLFVKTVPIFNKTQADYVTEAGLFKKESLLYQNVISKLSAISGVHIAPKHYLIKKHCLVFDDLMLRNFKIRGPYLNLEESQSLVQCLAKFHSATIVYEELYSYNGKKFRMNQEFKEELQETAFSFIEGQPRNKWLKNNTKCVSDIIKLIPGLKRTNEIIDELHNVALLEMESFIGSSNKFRNTVTHCDLWSNNFMINDKLECILVDFQLARYSPPAYDLLLTLILNTTTSFLEENLEYLLNFYYDIFSESLLKYNLLPEKMFSKKDFMDSVEYVKLPTLLEAVYFCTNTLIAPETSAYIVEDPKRYHEFAFTDRSKYVVKEFENNESFRKGFLEVLMPLIELLIDRIDSSNEIK